MNKNDAMLITVLGAWLKEKKPRKMFVVCNVAETVVISQLSGFLNLLQANVVRLDCNSVKHFCNGKAKVPLSLMLTGADDADCYTIERLLAADAKIMFFTKPNSALLKKAPKDAMIIVALTDGNN
jgi:hypothetical protein